MLKDENKRLQKHVEKLEGDIRELQQMISKESKHQLEEKQTIENDVNSSKGIIAELQQKLDEARGEIGLLNRKLNSSVRVRISFLFLFNNYIYVPPTIHVFNRPGIE